MAEPHHRGDQHVEHRLLGLDRVVQEPSLEPEPGVVDQQVDRAPAIGDPGLHRGQLLAVGEVGGQHLDGHAVPVPQLARLVLQPVTVAGDQDEVVAGGGELVGEGAADAGGGAGDQRGRGDHVPSIQVSRPRGQAQLGMIEA